MLILQYLWQLLVAGILIYLLSNVNFAVIFSKSIEKKDIRTLGSHNPGTTNVVRVFGLKLGALTFVCDMLKGVIAGVVGKYLFPLWLGQAQIAPIASYFFLLCAILGHIYPVFLGFKGGKGVATSIGFFLIVNTIPTLCCLAFALLIIYICDKVSVFALFHILFQAIWATVAVLTASLPLDVTVASLVSVWLACAIIVLAHRSNVYRLFHHTENNSGIKASLFGKKKPPEQPPTNSSTLPKE